MHIETGIDTFVKPRTKRMYIFSFRKTNEIYDLIETYCD